MSTALAPALKSGRPRQPRGGPASTPPSQHPPLRPAMSRISGLCRPGGLHVAPGDGQRGPTPGSSPQPSAPPPTAPSNFQDASSGCPWPLTALSRGSAQPPGRFPRRQVDQAASVPRSLAGPRSLRRRGPGPGRPALLCGSTPPSSHVPEATWRPSQLGPAALGAQGSLFRCVRRCGHRGHALMAWRTRVRSPGTAADRPSWERASSRSHFPRLRGRC